MSEILLSRKIR